MSGTDIARTTKDARLMVRDHLQVALLILRECHPERQDLAAPLHDALRAVEADIAADDGPLPLCVTARPVVVGLDRRRRCGSPS